jgi:hypothetical protein
MITLRYSIYVEHMSTYLYIYPWHFILFYLFIYLAIYAFIYLFIYSFIDSFIHLNYFSIIVKCMLKIWK